MKIKSGKSESEHNGSQFDKNEKKIIKIILADDHVAIRDGFKLLLEREPDLQVVAEAGTGEEVVRLASLFKPDVILMDISMPELNGLHATHQILRNYPETKIIILSMHQNEGFVEQAVQLGVRGYLLKENASQEIIKAVREVVINNHPYFCPEVQEILIKKRELDARSLDKPLINPREFEILQLIAEGKSNQEIANVLLLSVKTVEHHKHALKEKLKIPNTAGLIQYALRKGIITS